MRTLNPDLCSAVAGGIIILREYEFIEPVVEIEQPPPRPALDAEYSLWDHFWMGALVSATVTHIAFSSDFITIGSAFVGGGIYAAIKAPQ